MNPLLFLDFAGVLHHVDGPYFTHAERLADVLDAHPGVEIVLSTSWQYQEDTAARPTM